MAPISEAHGLEHSLRPFLRRPHPRELSHERNVLQRRERGHKMKKLKYKA